VTKYIVSYNRAGRHVMLHTNGGGQLEQVLVLARALAILGKVDGITDVDVKAGNGYGLPDDRGRVIWLHGSLTEFGKTVGD
jgi:hypothetical protein